MDDHAKREEDSKEEASPNKRVKLNNDIEKKDDNNDDNSSQANNHQRAGPNDQYNNDSNNENNSNNNNNNEDNEDNSDEGEGETIDLSNMDQESLMQLLRSVSAAHGIPMSMLLASLHDDDDDRPDDDDNDDTTVEYHPRPTSIRDVARFIQSAACRRILILAGAGMSVSAGIPDYRSEDGFYATLSATALTATTEQQQAIQRDKTVALDQHLFLENPLPCLELKRDFILGVHDGRWKPTLAHYFCSLLATHTNVRSSSSSSSSGGGGGEVKSNNTNDDNNSNHDDDEKKTETTTTTTSSSSSSKLVRWYTQNIDGLESPLEIASDKIVHVHGTMSQANCAACGKAYPSMDVFCRAVRTQIKDVLQQDPSAPAASTPIVCPHCHAPAVKPAITLFRSSLPRLFFERLPGDVADADLLLILGTSLKVAPANSIVWRVPKTCVRVVLNREPVGFHLGIRENEDDDDDNNNNNDNTANGNTTDDSNNTDEPQRPRYNKRDYFAEGDCDQLALDLMDELGWLDQVQKHMENLPAQSAALLRARLAEKAATTTATTNS